MFRAACLALFALTGQARACEVALALTIDVSSSVDAGEYRLQVDGLADALAQAPIREALLQADASLTVIHWSGVNKQSVVMPWTQMTDLAAIDAFAATERALPRAFFDSDTAVGDAIDFAVAQFAEAPDCKRRVIDISGDGSENAGGDTAEASARAQAQGIEINAIAIESIGVALTGFYQRNAITLGGFVVTAHHHEDYARAIAEKLFRELTKVIS